MLFSFVSCLKTACLEEKLLTMNFVKILDNQGYVTKKKKPSGFLLLVLVLFLSNCKPKEISVDEPDRLIPQDTMAMILRDIHFAEARVNKLNVSATDSTRLIFEVAEKKIYQKYHIDTTVYRQNYRYYVTDPERFGELYKKVVKDIEDRNRSLNIN